MSNLAVEGLSGGVCPIDGTNFPWKVLVLLISRHVCRGHGSICPNKVVPPFVDEWKKGKPMTINLWVNGQEYVAHCDETIDVENPATGKVVDQLALADKHCLDQSSISLISAEGMGSHRPGEARGHHVQVPPARHRAPGRDRRRIVREGGKTHGDASARLPVVARPSTSHAVSMLLSRVSSPIRPRPA